MPQKAIKALCQADMSEKRQLVQLSRTLKLKSTNVVSGFKGHLKSVSPGVIQHGERKSQQGGQYNVVLKRGDRYVVLKSRSKIYSFKNTFRNLYQTKWNISKVKVTKYTYCLFKLNKMYRLFIAQFILGNYNYNCLKKVLGMIERKVWKNLYDFLQSLHMPRNSRKTVNKKILFGEPVQTKASQTGVRNIKNLVLKINPSMAPEIKESQLQAKIPEIPVFSPVQPEEDIDEMDFKDDSADNVSQDGSLGSDADLLLEDDF